MLSMLSLRKVLNAVLSGRSDQNIRFADLRKLVLARGFDERGKGDRHIYTRVGVAQINNLQPRNDSKAKPYKDKQLRNLITHDKLGIDR